MYSYIVNADTAFSYKNSGYYKCINAIYFSPEFLLWSLSSEF